MISVEEAQQRVLDTVRRMPVTHVGLVNAAGLVLARQIVSEADVPPLDNSAMDGFAVKAVDIARASTHKPVILKVAGEIPAGSVWRKALQPGSALRIMTGAPIPPGADCVVRFEDTDEEERRGSRQQGISKISIFVSSAPGANIRKSGEDISSGSVVLKRGHLLRAADIGVMASLGIARVPVYRPPRVAILATGNELSDPGRMLKPGKIYNSNSYCLAALVKASGAVPVLLGIAGDNQRSLQALLYRAMECDLILTSGGVSLGDYDLVKNVLSRTGRIEFWTVRMKPGKPLAFGVFNTPGGVEVPHLGLPGNPVSVMVTFELFARPAIYSMLGRRDLLPSTIKAKLASDVRNNDGRRVFVRVTLSQRHKHLIARPTGDQGSGILTSMARADGLAIIPEDMKLATKDTVVDVIPLNREYPSFDI
jgi:molybdopterin molybdotransferase